jgi:hypothetical protein
MVLCPVLRRFFTCWLAFLFTGYCKFSVQMCSIVLFASFSLRNFRIVSSESSCDGAVHYSSCAFLCYKIPCDLNPCKEILHLAPGNIIGMIFSMMFRILHLIDLLHCIEIFINESIKWSTFNKDDLPLLSYCFYQLFSIVDR